MTDRPDNSRFPGAPPEEKGRAALITTLAVVAVLAIGGLAWAGAAGAPTPAHHRAVAVSSRTESTSGRARATQAPPAPSTPAPSTPAAATPAAPAVNAPPPAVDKSTPQAAPDPRFGLPVGATTSLTEPATLSGGITAHIDSVTPITVKGKGIGEVSGPAVSIAVTLTNTTASPVSLDQVSVGAYYGGHATPGSPIRRDKDTSLHGALGPGASATGTYVFSIPKNERSSVTVTVTDAAGAPLVVFH